MFLYIQTVIDLCTWAPAGFFPGVGNEGGLKDRSPPTGSEGSSPVGVCGLSPQKLTFSQNNAYIA